MSQTKLSRQQKLILGWVYVISRKQNGLLYKYWANGSIYAKAVRELIYPHPSRSQSAGGEGG